MFVKKYECPLKGLSLTRDSSLILLLHQVGEIHMREAAMYQVRVLACIDTLWIKSPLCPDGVHIETEERVKLYF